MAIYAGKEIGPTVSRTMGELASIKDTTVYTRKNNENGQESKQEVKLEDLYKPLMLKFGLLDKTNPNNPASEDDISKLEEIKLTDEKKKELNKDVEQLDAFECRICLLELEDSAIQAPCGHLFHKDCLFPWLQIHNRCPLCKELVVK